MIRLGHGLRAPLRPIVSAKMPLILLAGALIVAPVPAQAQNTPDPVSAVLADAGPGTRWGVVIADDDGRENVALNPDGPFIPASNTKIFTTAAALWAEARGEGPKLAESGATVGLEANDVVLRGHGDAGLSARPDCVSDCLATLAKAVAAKTKRVRDVIGDATLFPDQRWSPGMSWNNIPTSSGTAVAALVVDDNEIAATVTPGAKWEPPVVSVLPYYAVRTVANAPDDEERDTLAYDRMPGSRDLVVTGAVPPDTAEFSWQLGVDDPAHYAAWRFAEMLKEHGVRVTGAIRSRYCQFVPEEGRASLRDREITHSRKTLATLVPGTLAQEVATINKRSQNLHAELLLRRLGLARDGNGSIGAGQAMVTAMLAEAGVAPEQVSLSDGSGMSSYNRVAPRATVKLLQWIARQSWADDFRSSLPVGGVDGTLRARFTGTGLSGKIFAKTGTLNATNALAGWLIAARGKPYTFSGYAHDVPETLRATSFMDQALTAFAATH